MQTFNYLGTPKAVIVKALGDEPYTMELAFDDGILVMRLVNIGIDSHLEACFIKERGDDYNWRQGRLIGSKLDCTVSPESMLVLLRRLEEQGSDEALALRSDILTTLDIEEI